jgi:FlaA1/EpsC-like NDP-sugar epimerase
MPMISKELNKAQNTFFNIFIVVTYLLYGLFVFGIFKKAPQYLEVLDYYIKIYISLFLLWRFNIFRYNIHFTELDRKIVFTAGLFLFTTTAVNTILMQYLKNAKDTVIQKLDIEN